MIATQHGVTVTFSDGSWQNFAAPYVFNEPVRVELGKIVNADEIEAFCRGLESIVFTAIKVHEVYCNE